jgi:hypothetical protein
MPLLIVGIADHKYYVRYIESFMFPFYPFHAKVFASFSSLIIQRHISNVSGAAQGKILY